MSTRRLRSRDDIHREAEQAGAGEVARALTGAAGAHELAGRERVLLLFSAEPEHPHRAGATVVRVKLAATLAGLAVGLAAAGVAAAGLGSPVADGVARVAVAPAPAATTIAGVTGPVVSDDEGDDRPDDDTGVDEGGATTGTARPATADPPAGPDARGSAAHGLCTSWSAHQRNGAHPSGSVAMRSLAEVAGGESGIADYCAQVLEDRASARPGRPTDAPRTKDRPQPKSPAVDPTSSTRGTPQHKSTAGHGPHGTSSPTTKASGSDKSHHADPPGRPVGGAPAQGSGRGHARGAPVSRS